MFESQKSHISPVLTATCLLQPNVSNCMPRNNIHVSPFRLFEVIETYTKYYLIMEHAAAGELFKRLISEGRMHESEAKNIFAQIVLAVKHLVSNCFPCR